MTLSALSMTFLNKINKKALVCACLSVVLCAVAVFSSVMVHKNNVFTPDYERLDLSGFIEKELTQQDYKTLFYQTGLGKSAVDKILLAENALERLNAFQEQFFAQKDAKCVREVLTTCMEYSDTRFTIAPYQEGDIIAMLSSHSFGWRHGHIGLIIGPNRTLEAPIIGEPSTFYSLSQWRTFSTFVLLRVRDIDAEQAKQIAISASDNLYGVYYSPLASVFKKYSGPQPKSVQCASLVWTAFYSYGIDLDSNGGNIITVNDIIYSDKLEIVQIYGLNPQKFEKLL